MHCISRPEVRGNRKVQREKRKGIVSAGSSNVQVNTVLSQNDLFGKPVRKFYRGQMTLNLVQSARDVYYVLCIVSDVCRMDPRFVRGSTESVEYMLQSFKDIHASTLEIDNGNLMIH